jgi:lipoprotein-releasing system permease protein
MNGLDEIVVGMELAHVLGITLGDSVNLITLAGEGVRSVRPENIEFELVGIFKSGYYEFDRGLGFITLDSIAGLAAKSDTPVIGVKLDNRYQDRKIAGEILTGIPALSEPQITSWREFNSSFFGALRMEKLAMMILIGLIFLVVGGNIYHSLKRSVYERLEEICLLKSIGASTKSIQRIFIFDGIFIGSLGGITGTALGLLISFNINKLFRIFETVSNGVLTVVRQIVNPMVAAGIDEISIFSPRYYYMSEVPVKLPFREVLLVCMFAFLSSVIAAFFASRRISRVKPSEVLRYE